VVGRRTRKPPAITPAALDDAAVRYLGRYAACADGVRRVLRRRVERAVRLGDADREAGLAEVEAAIGRLVAAGLIDDRSFAVTRAAAMHRRGMPLGRIRERLRCAGLTAEDVATGVAAVAETAADPDWAAAVAFARRRRFGPFAAAEESPERQTHTLAAFARAGFSYPVARRILEARTPDDLDDV